MYISNFFPFVKLTLNISNYVGNFNVKREKIRENNVNIEKAFSETDNNFTHLKMMVGRNPIFVEWGKQFRECV